MVKVIGFLINNTRELGVLSLGIALGFILQRSRFCIASAFSDFILFKDSSLLRAVIIFIIISMFGFFVIQQQGSEGYIVALGWRTVIGGLLFGIGMALAGGCAVGSLMRIGEGYLLFLPALFGLVMGGAFGAYQYDYWGNPESLKNIYFLPSMFGWVSALVIQTILFAIIFLVFKYLLDKSGDE